MRFKRLKDWLGYVLGYGYCRDCGRTMWLFSEGEWFVMPGFKVVCRVHL